MIDGNHLTRYFADVDAGDFESARSRLSPGVTFAIHLPGDTRRGTTSDELIGYLDGRGPVDRAHHPLRTSTADDVEFVYGKVVEDGVTTTGHFLAAVRVHDGLIASYQVSFDVEQSLLEEVAS